MRFINNDIECPSLSPDQTRIAYKKRNDNGLGPVTWRLWVLDLASGRRWPLAETRNVDDQAAWLDDITVMYSIQDDSPGSGSFDTWVTPADGGGQPRLFLPGVASAVVVRSSP